LAAFIHLFGLSSKNAHSLSNERRHLYFQFTPFIIRRVFEINPKSITYFSNFIFQMPAERGEHCLTYFHLTPSLHQGMTMLYLDSKARKKKKPNNSFNPWEGPKLC
jgi:hypothetical protein